MNLPALKRFIFSMGHGAILACLVGVFSAHAIAEERIDWAARMAKSPGWLKLLHMPAHGEPSAIHDARFFLSPTGASDPEAELRATLAGMAEVPTTADKHVRCRYPARVRWIEAQQAQTAAFDHAVHCPAHVEWRRNNRIGSLSLVFATGYLGNPASYYGHTLLKFNEEGGAAPTDLLNSTVNYGAIETSGDDPLSYIFKGIFGGYDAVFSHADFYFHESNYGENELRDLWEYRLSLPKSDVDFVVDHAWEVLGKRYTYFFFRHNCAYRMTELLEILDGVDINPRNRPYTLPQVVVANLAKAAYQGRLMVSEVIHHASRQSRFHQRYRALGETDARLFVRMVREGVDAQAPAFDLRPLLSKQRILDAAMDYYRFSEMTPGQVQPDGGHPEYLRALAMRYRLPPGGEPPPVSDAVPPDRGRAPSWIQTGMSWNRKNGKAGLLRIRPAYYDPLDAGGGHVANARLSMGDTAIRIVDGRIRLDWFDIVAIDSIGPGLSGLPGDNGEAWKLKAGVEPAHSGCSDCLVPRIQGDVGYGRQLSPSAFVAAYVGAGAQDNRHDAGRAFARITVDAILRAGPFFSMKLSSEQRAKMDARNHSEQIHRVEARWAVGKSADVRLEHIEGEYRQSRIGVGLYW